MHSEDLLTLLGMALIAYMTRAGGFWLMSRVAPSPMVERWLQRIPGAVLVAVVAPTLFPPSPAQVLAAVSTILTAIYTKNVLLAMLVGIGMISVLRHV